MSVIKFKHDREQIVVPVAVLPPSSQAGGLRMLRLRGLIDTGASLCGVPAHTVQELGLARNGKMVISTPAGDHVARIYRFRIGLFPDEEAQLPHVLDDEFLAVESHPGAKFDVLIGMNVLGSGDLYVNRDGTGSFRF